MRSSTLRLILLALAGITFFVPLILSPAHFIFPFIVPKVLVFRTIVLLMTGGYVVLLGAHWNEFKIKFSPITIAVLLFLLSLTISTFMGVDWYHSFWDNHERMLGLFTIIHYVLYYLVLSVVVKDWKEWRWLFRVFLFAGSIVMFLGILQLFKTDLLLNQNGGRIASTLGNPIYVGGYGLFLAFSAWLLFMREELRGWKVFAVITGLLGFLGIFLSGTRGSVMGLLAGIFVLGLAYLFMMKEHAGLRKKLFIILAAFVVLLGFLFAFRKTEVVSSIPGLGSLLNSFTNIQGTAATRIMAWGIAYEGWLEHPIFGWGPNNYYYVFNKYYRPEFLEHGWTETWFDNAHNIVMNTLAVQGSFGIITYFGMFGTVIFLLYRRWCQGRLDRNVAAVGVAFLVANFIHNVFVFGDPTSYLYFFFFLAFLNSSAIKSDPNIEVSSNNFDPVNITAGMGGTVLVVVILFIYSTNINPARANMATFSSLQALYSSVDPIGKYKYAASIPSPHIDDIRSDFSRTVTQVYENYASNGRVEEARQMLDFARGELRKNIDLHPEDIRTHILLSDIDQRSALLNQDTSYLLDAEELLTRALELSPKRQQIQYSLALVKLNLRKFDEAISLLKQSIKNDPKVTEGWWRLAYFYKELGKNDYAEMIVREARARNLSIGQQGESIFNTILPAGATGTPVELLPPFSLD